MDRHFTWYGEPARWSRTDDRLSVVTARDTDFWQSTFYGFRRDNGHHYHTPVTGDFTTEVLILGQYRVLYDQAGLMLRVDSGNWIKTGVEYTDGLLHFSTVVTRDGHSDWSMVPFGPADEPVRLRLTRHDEALRVQYHRDGIWRMARLGYLDMPETTAVGPMCCSPQRAGFEVEFRDFRIGPAIDRALHED